MTDPAASSDRIAVLLVDDHALVRGGLRRLLTDDPAIAVIGEVSDGETAVRLVSSLAPDVVVLDYLLPDADGLAILRRIRTAQPAAAVVMLSMRDDESLVRDAFQAGAAGFLVKDETDITLVDAVRLAARGEAVVSARLADGRGRAGVRGRLTPRQLDVLRLICLGRSAVAIAAELGLSEYTVRVHRAGIMRALGIHRTTALVAYAVGHGLVQIDGARAPRDQSSST